MFYRDGILERSTILTWDRCPVVCHGFSTRLGGVSGHPYTSAMNLAKGREDPDSVVCANMEIFARTVTVGALGNAAVVTAGQIHSAKVRVVTAENRGEGVILPAAEPCDGFVTDVPGVFPVIRVADCVPILLCGEKEDGRPVIGAVHAGWRGSASGIASAAVRTMVSLGACLTSIRAAIGTHIGLCCYTVQNDFVRMVADMAGEAFARRFCIPVSGGAHADLTGMNRYYLTASGVTRVDVSPYCTMCRPAVYHSHRATSGKRGAMGAGIVILPDRADCIKPGA